MHDVWLDGVVLAPHLDTGLPCVHCRAKVRVKGMAMAHIVTGTAMVGPGRTGACRNVRHNG